MESKVAMQQNVTTAVAASRPLQTWNLKDQLVYSTNHFHMALNSALPYPLQSPLTKHAQLSVGLILNFPEPTPVNRIRIHLLPYTKTISIAS